MGHFGWGKSTLKTFVRVFLPTACFSSSLLPVISLLSPDFRGSSY